ncbi:9927_t:CDS:2 [Ambispora leptoticha]|uniref:Nitrate/nitrite transporter n=1 Tax=Ambispora leptoticha TaxID=144679 RepID=A0A9N8W5E1_9GLOM|nr:9927_t:CDS:2 [Ambispora leptoticha]
MINLFANPIPIEESTQKADGINLFSFARPYMRAFHFSWLSFNVAFTGWFAISPLMPTIRKDLGLSPTNVNNSNIASVAATVLFRMLVGPLCDQLGPRRVMAIVLIIGSIPTGLAGLATSATSLIIVRFFIGFLGAAFVPCQFWTTQMFSSRTVGSANALVGGWGNMGAGITYLILPVIFNLFCDFGLTPHQSWRVVLVVPVILLVTVGICNLLFADDCPQGDWSQHWVPNTEKVNNEKVNNEKVDNEKVNNEKREDSEKIIAEKKQDNETSVDSDSEKQNVKPTSRPKPKDFLRALKNHNVIILMCMYSCSFGLELAVDNVIGLFFVDQFGLSQTFGGLVGALFGLMNFLSRPSGGFISDAANKRMGIRGRMITQFCILCCEGVFLIVFRYTCDSLTGALIALVFFSYFTQACAGSTFGIVPFVDPPIVGAISGLVGAGGNLGGLLLIVVFRASMVGGS